MSVIMVDNVIPNRRVKANTDWITFRASQSYPLADNAYKMTNVKRYLPPSLLLDIRLTIPSQSQTLISNNICISAIYDSGKSLTVLLAGKTELNKWTTFAQCAGISKELDSTNSLSERCYPITPLDISADTLRLSPWMNKVVGTLCAGFTKQYKDGTVTFDPGEALLNPMCVDFVAGDHLEALVVDDKYLTGQVQLVLQKGIKCAVQQNKVYIGIDSNYIASQVGKQARATESYIKSINGIKPVNGNITINGLDCVQVKASDNALIISNPCAKPCCKTQDSIQNIQATVDLLKEQHKILRDYFVNMSTNINYMQSNLTNLAVSR